MKSSVQVGRQLRQFKLNLFFHSLQKACQISQPEFCKETETFFVSDSDSACSCVFDQPANSGSDFCENSDEDLKSTAMSTLEFGLRMGA